MMSELLALSLMSLLGALEAPVTEVTIFGDRARVTRTAQLRLKGEQRVELPPLLDSVDPGSIRVEAVGARVLRVEIAPVDADSFPVDAARSLLNRIEATQDRLGRLTAEQQAHEAQLEQLRRVSPSPPEPTAARPPPLLEGRAWPQAIAFITTREQTLQDRAREGQAAIDALRRELERLLMDAGAMGASQRRSGFQVTPTLAGQGQATVRVTYFAGPARWEPTYDLRLDTKTGKVAVLFAGLASQQTGEDWEGAKLILSTALPATAIELPKLWTWKIGEAERFIPTPRPSTPPLPPPPHAPPLLPEPPGEPELLRQRILAHAGHRVQAAAERGDRAAQLETSAMPTPDAPRLPPQPQRAPSRSRPRSERPMAAAPQAPMAAMDEGSAPYSEEAIRVANDAPPPAQVGLAPPPAYRPPIPDPRSPAGRAGGHALEFTSLHRETLRSGSGGRRIALFSESWPVEVERKLFPALAEDAFLVAELKSPGKSFLPAGEARLHVGDDPAGVAQLPLVAPGEAFTLPLGVDRALRPVRNVRVLTGERGLFGSDEVTGYEVTIELANPYPHPVKVRVLDQWPLSSQEKVEVALLRTEPYALQDATTGALEWRLTLPPGGKTTVSFAYSLRRPKGWRLHQNQ